MSKNITQKEARTELSRRHRDPETGRKVGKHVLRDTDARYNIPRDEILALRTPELKTLAGIGAPAPAPVAVSTPVVPSAIPANWVTEWDGADQFRLVSAA